MNLFLNITFIFFSFLLSQATVANPYTIYSTNILAREKNTIDSKIPVILLHGINNLPRTFRVLRETILKQDPQRPVYELHTHYDGVPGSWESLHVQLNDTRLRIQSLINQNPQHFATKENAYDLVCHSQGSLICRALCETTENHSVRTFISLAGPQMGVYGDGWIKFFPPKLRNVTIEDAYKIAYQDWAQKSLSVANMWHDPYNEKIFLEKNTFLPNLLYPQKANPKYKENFLRLKRAVFLVGDVGYSNHGATTFDGGIDPWFSGIWSFYNEKGEIIPLKKQKIYKDDTFGLRTLDETKRLFLNAVPNIPHDDWLYNETVITKYIIPHLYQNVKIIESIKSPSMTTNLRIT